MKTITYAKAFYEFLKDIGKKMADSKSKQFLEYFIKCSFNSWEETVLFIYAMPRALKIDSDNVYGPFPADGDDQIFHYGESGIGRFYGKRIGLAAGIITAAVSLEYCILNTDSLEYGILNTHHLYLTALPIATNAVSWVYERVKEKKHSLESKVNNQSK